MLRTFLTVCLNSTSISIHFHYLVKTIHNHCIIYTCIFILESVKIFFEKDEDKKKGLEEKMHNEIAPAFIKNMTTVLTKNGGQYMVGKGVS